jgi:hypothetical protein
MNLAYRTLFAGMLAIVFCSTAVAHERHVSGWTGGVAVSVSTHGGLYWDGGFRYGPVVAYPARRVAWPRIHRVPLCHHPIHRHPVVHRRGHRHGNEHRVIHVYH